MSGYFTKIQTLNHTNSLTYCFFCKLPNWHSTCLVPNKYLFLALLNTFQPGKGIKRKTQMKNKFLKGIVASFALVVSGFANAGLIQVFDPVNMDQGPYIFEDFEDTNFVSGVDLSFLSIYSGDGVEHTGNYGALNNGSLNANMNFVFSETISSFGLWFGNDDLCCTSAFTSTLDIYDLSGFVGSISVQANMNDVNDQFIGFTSDLSVSSVTLRYAGGGGLALAIDDLQFNAQEVPEPHTLAIFALGLMGLASRKFKKQA